MPKKRKKHRQPPEVKSLIKLLEQALTDTEEAADDLTAAVDQLEDAMDMAGDASNQAEGVAEVLRERIEKLKKSY